MSNPIDRAFSNALKHALEQSETSFNAELLAGCLEHYRLLLRWNRTHNLTRITDPKEAAIKHYADSILGGLCLGSLLLERSFLDLGSGAGFPGVMMALMGASGTLLDASQKRCSFLETVRRELNLGDQLQVQHGRAEEAPQCALVLSRATFSESSWEVALRCVQPGGTLVVWTAGGDALPRWESFVDGKGWSNEVKPVALPSQDDRALFLAHRPPD